MSLIIALCKLFVYDQNKYYQYNMQYDNKNKKNYSYIINSSIISKKLQSKSYSPCHSIS